MLGHDQPDAYSEADERLVSTVASSMGVALANARLFDETKRLLAETDQRAAELALVNEIGSALAKQLDFDAIIELVGERVRSIFDARSIFIAIYDEATNTITWPYDIDEGERFDRGTYQLGPGITSRSFVRSGRSAPRQHRGADRGRCDPSRRHRTRSRGSACRSRPAIASSASSASRASRNMHSARPTSGCLTTLASSMGVALENARLFDETKRLLAETDQRAAELALINEIGIGPRRAARLRGHRRARRRATAPRSSPGRPATCSSHWLTERANQISFPYWFDDGKRLEVPPNEIGDGLTSIVVNSKQPLRLDTLAESLAAGAIFPDGAAPTESWLGVPIKSGREVIGVICLSDPKPRRLQRGRRAPRLDAGLQHGRGPRERAPVRRDEASAGRDGPARGRAGA